MEDTLSAGKLYRWAIILAVFTVFYNILEGLVSVYLGFEDDALSLFGFGVDSFVEAISGVGVWHMAVRIRQNLAGDTDVFERQTLKITGGAFYILAAGLIASTAYNIIQGKHPKTAFWGIVVSCISIMVMWLLVHYKVKVGTQLNSQAILSDAACTRTCIYLSVVLLVGSIGYELTGVGWFDSAGALIIAALSYKEGREAFEKARGKSCCCGHTCAPPAQND
ncbi:cation transporter [Candidatus Magnetominusculus xianensis]|uniref:Membrane protein n=1 Tax=Candidatus Magnetominusculus xianensis TaxID=1748249 RepID=A0ABR5SD44_9BACT|nr:cation transporter [Candidatus Magnetominusculus xianensis]KWT82782.1 membrane protein [Candidatus Magnetominusculus xianensis]MBF0403471.1 cation transporter [Nitrospirota bacterium]